MNRFFGMIPTPPPLRNRSSVYDLKTRLDWGNPALTIVDVCDRAVFNREHIMGAISMPLDQLVDRAIASLPRSRDLYLYGETDEETAAAAAALRSLGYQNVSEIRGGVAAWKAVGFQVESSGRCWYS